MISKTHIFKSVTVVITATTFVFFTGCGDVIKQPYPVKAYFGLEPGIPDQSLVGQPATRPIIKSVMLIKAVRVIPPYDGLAFVNFDGNSKYDSDYYVNWIASPSALFTGGLTAWLDRGGPLPVVTDGSTIRADMVLDSQVTRLAIDRTDPSKPHGVIAMRFFLGRQTNAGSEILLDTSCTADFQVSADNPEGYATAWGLAFRQVLQRLCKDLNTVAHQ